MSNSWWNLGTSDGSTPVYGGQVTVQSPNGSLHTGTTSTGGAVFVPGTGMIYPTGN